MGEEVLFINEKDAEIGVISKLPTHHGFFQSGSKYVSKTGIHSCLMKKLMKVYELHKWQFLPTGIDEAWRFFSKAANFAKITPA